MESGPVGLIKAAKRLDEALTKAERHDYLERQGNKVARILAKEGDQQAILSYGSSDPRRNAHPLEFTRESSFCFCHWKAEQPTEWFAATEASQIFIRPDRGHQYATDCGPEPTLQHYRDMMKLAHHLKTPNLTVVNLANSGASVPQHFHTQIFPVRLRKQRKTGPNSLATLWKNIRCSAEIHQVLHGVTIREVLSPVWGISLEFDHSISPEKRGEILFRAVHQALRYRSQLALTYNVFLHHESRHVVTVLIREPKYERIFELDEIRILLEQIAGHDEARKIVASNNRMWRWAWLECIGGLPARDNSFEKVELFGWPFWSRIWKRISLQEPLRESVLKQVCASLSQLDGDPG